MAWMVSRLPPRGAQPCPGGALPCRRGPWQQTVPAPPPSPRGSWCSPRPCWATRWKAGELASGSGQQSAGERAQDGFSGEPRGTHNVLHTDDAFCVSVFPPGVFSQCRTGVRHPEKMCVPPFSVLVRYPVFCGARVTRRSHSCEASSRRMRCLAAERGVDGRGVSLRGGTLAGWRDIGWRNIGWRDSG